jgi:holo-[acyl-carrier protein] synthase
VPAGTTELGIDIVKVERIRAAIERFGERFSNRVLTPSERRYCPQPARRRSPGRWAAKEAVSKVLGLGVRGIGWKDIEVERLPTASRRSASTGRAAQRAEQLGWGGSRCRSPTSRTTPSRSRSGCARRAASTCSRSTSTTGSTIESGTLLARFERMRDLHERTRALAAEIDEDEVRA